MKAHRTLARIIRLLRRIGITLNPFFVVEEGQFSFPSGAKATGLQLSVAAPSHVPELLTLQKDHTEASLAQWFAEGKVCFIAKVDGRISALMWADLEAFNYPPNFRLLAEDEAYLFAAIAAPELRGLNLAPTLRRYCYETLRAQGIRRFYSYSDLLNSPARRFKAKLNARETALRVHIDLWGLWAANFTLRSYD